MATRPEMSVLPPVSTGPATPPSPDRLTYSLRRRLLGLLISATTLLWLATLGAAFLRAHSIADDIFDAHLQQTARTLLSVVPSDGDGHVDAPAAPAAGGGEVLFQMWQRQPEGMQLMLHSAGAGQEPLTGQEGFSETEWRGGEWRFYSEWSSDHERQVQVGQSHDIRYQLAQDAALRLLAPLVAGLPLLAAALWFGVSRGLLPLGRIARQLEQRRPDSPEPLATGTPIPQEVAPLILALDGLFSRIARVLENERQFTANAAHELRTPLAALKTQTQVALRADGEGKQRALLQVLEGTERLARMVEQLLTLARLDPGANFATQPLDLTPLAQEACALQAPAALDRNVSLEFEGQGRHGIQGNPDLLRILLRNLLDNAVRYTRPGGHVWVRLAREGEPSGRGEKILLSVTDDGPGIPGPERERALHRFTRLDPGRAEGSGLGLSIVARVAELHGAALSLGVGPEGLGLRVLVLFPRAGE